MTLRAKLFALFALAIIASAGVLAWSVERYAESQFRESDQQHSAALVAQFQSELAQRGAEVSASVQGIADAESTLRMVLDLNRPAADPSVYANDARGLAKSHGLDFLELAGADGTLISSAQWPERVGNKNGLVGQETDWNQRSAFLDRVETADRVELGLVAVRAVRAGNKSFYIVGGRRLDSDFLRSLAVPAGMRALFYRNLEQGFVPAALSDAEGPLAGAESFASLIESLPKQPGASQQTMEWNAGSGSAERFITLPLAGRHGELLGALLVGSAQRQLIALETYIRDLALVVAGAGLLLAFAMSWWISARVTRPLEILSAGIAEVAAGDWDTPVKAGAVPEVRQVIRSFNRMTEGLADERSAQIARERSSAGRELAAQLAGELSASLSPLPLAVETIAQREESGEETPELHDSVSALRQGLESLRASGSRLKDFAALSTPRLEAVNLGEALRAALQSFESQFSAMGRPPVTPELYLDDRMAPVRADPALLRKALENLLLFLLEDMPAGGTLTIRTRQQGGMAHVIFSDTGTGLVFEPQDSAGSFSPYRTARAPGTALRLATVQAIVSGHAGKISMESARATGLTFYLDLPSDSFAPSARPEPKPQPAAAKSAPAKPGALPEPSSPAPVEQRPAEQATEVEAPAVPVQVQPEVALEMQRSWDSPFDAQFQSARELHPEAEPFESEDLWEIEPLEEAAEETDEKDWAALADVLHEAQIRLVSDEPGTALPVDGGPEHETGPHQESEQNLGQQGSHEPDFAPHQETVLEAVHELVHAANHQSQKPSAEAESKRIWVTYR